MNKIRILAENNRATAVSAIATTHSLTETKALLLPRHEYHAIEIVFANPIQLRAQYALTHTRTHA